MSAQPALRVSSPPPKPLIIWDGECHFCRRWIERWKEITWGEVYYEASQQFGERFPEIPRAQFERSVILIEPDGAVYFGATLLFGVQEAKRLLKRGRE